MKLLFLLILPLFTFAQRDDLNRAQHYGATLGNASGIHYELAGQLTCNSFAAFGAELLYLKKAVGSAQLKYIYLAKKIAPFAAVHYVLTQPTGYGLEGGLQGYWDRLGLSLSYRHYNTGEWQVVRSGVFVRFSLVVWKGEK
jgi:hypothetical protein